MSADASEVGAANARDRRDAVALLCRRSDGAAYLEPAFDHDVAGLTLPLLARIGVDDQDEARMGALTPAHACARRIAREHHLPPDGLTALGHVPLGHGGHDTPPRLHVFGGAGEPRDAAGAWWSPDALEDAWRAGRVLCPVEIIRLVAGAALALDAPRTFCWQPGLRWIPLRSETLPPATHTCCYVLGEARLTVVDPGCTNAREIAALTRALETLEGDGARVTHILLTHHHPDHIGAVPALLAARPELTVRAHPEAIGHLPPAWPTEPLVEGDDVVGFTVVRTPGHTAGHVALHHPTTGALICGDLVASIGTIVVSPPEGNMADYFRSLERARALAPSVLYPSHGAPILEPEEHIDAYLAHRGAREAQIVEALRGGAARMSTREIVAVVYAAIPPHVWPLAERNVIAHLEKLEEEGRAAVDEDGRWTLQAQAI